MSYFSYIFCYHDVMCGPLVFYNDYVAFIDGSCYSTQKQGDTTEDIPSPLVGILNVGIHPREVSIPLTFF